MNTSYHTLTTWNDGAMAAGFDSAAVEFRRENRDNVIDLSVWRAANLDELRGELENKPDLPDWNSRTIDRLEPALPPRRVRRSRRAMVLAELISTMSVVAVAAVMIIRVLTF